VKCFNLDVKVEDYIIPQVTRIKYFGFIYSTKRRRNRKGCKPSNPSMVEMEKCLVCFMWCESTIKVEGDIFYQTTVKLAMLVKNRYEYKVSVTETKILCWMYGKNRGI